MYVSKKEGRINDPVVLKIKLEAVSRPGVMFSDCDATRHHWSPWSFVSKVEVGLHRLESSQTEFSFHLFLSNLFQGLARELYWETR